MEESGCDKKSNVAEPIVRDLRKHGGPDNTYFACLAVSFLIKGFRVCKQWLNV